MSGLVILAICGLVVVSVVLAYLAGLGKGAAVTYERLRPERLQQEAIREIQRIHETGMAQIVTLPAAEPSPATPPVGIPRQVVVERRLVEGYGYDEQQAIQRPYGRHAR